MEVMKFKRTITQMKIQKKFSNIDLNWKKKEAINLDRSVKIIKSKE